MLRSLFYVESARHYLADVALFGVLDLPMDGRVAWNVHPDLAKAVRFEGLPTLTAEQAPEFDDIAKTLDNLTGHPVKWQTITDDELRTQLAATASMLSATLTKRASHENG